jgi:hypothetical protein
MPFPRQWKAKTLDTRHLPARRHFDRGVKQISEAARLGERNGSGASGECTSPRQLKPWFATLPGPVASRALNPQPVVGENRPTPSVTVPAHRADVEGTANRGSDQGKPLTAGAFQGPGFSVADSRRHENDTNVVCLQKWTYCGGAAFAPLGATHDQSPAVTCTGEEGRVRIAGLRPVSDARAQRRGVAVAPLKPGPPKPPPRRKSWTRSAGRGRGVRPLRVDNARTTTTVRRPFGSSRGLTPMRRCQQPRRGD